ncbi:MAG: M1 family metallopeptidase [Flavobacteriia bacterium]|nr:M1 family metallopeptidase [Flavobacteriia bacterium]
MQIVKSSFIIFVFIQILFSCGSSNGESNNKKIVSIGTSTVLAHSYSNTTKINTKHLTLDLDIDFVNKTVYGVARHEMENHGSDTAIFDIKALEIQKVTIGNGNEHETDFIIGKKDDLLGQPLFVKIKKDTKFVNIYYKTTDKTEALDWLDPKLTEGKKYPFMYSQGEAILTRSWIPIQDVPSNRITYSANVKVPKDLLALMSAENPRNLNPEGKYHFEMRQPIPCYLIAIAVGNIAYRKLGPNCGVYSEPELIQKCKYEFVDMPKMIGAAEKIYGKYQWEQYDILLLPYSFPFGGMENPRLTFANPTLLAGDRSLVSVIAHELAHSWSGNLVTNAAWEDFWLNEGFTVYFENRIMEELYGKEVADMLAIIEFQELQSEMKTINEGEFPEDTQLKLALTNRNPDEGMTSVAYVKGAFFLKTLEQKVGRELFDKFLKLYFKENAFKTVTTEGFEKLLNTELLKPNNITFNTKEWLYAKGLPSNCIHLKSQRFEDVQTLADRFASGEDLFKVKKSKKRKKQKKSVLTRDKFSTQEWLAFIRHLPTKMDPKQLQKLDDKLNFKGWGNSEIQTEWYVLGIHSGYKGIKPNLKKFLNKIGRRKYIAPLYQALSENPDDLIWAKKVFIKAGMGYHFVTRSSVIEILYPHKEHVETKK